MKRSRDGISTETRAHGQHTRGFSSNFGTTGVHEHAALGCAGIAAWSLGKPSYRVKRLCIVGSTDKAGRDAGDHCRNDGIPNIIPLRTDQVESAALHHKQASDGSQRGEESCGICRPATRWKKTRSIDEQSAKLCLVTAEASLRATRGRIVRHAECWGLGERGKQQTNNNNKIVANLKNASTSCYCFASAPLLLGLSSFRLVSCHSCMPGAVKTKLKDQNGHETTKEVIDSTKKSAQCTNSAGLIGPARELWAPVMYAALARMSCAGATFQTWDV